jgi:hypothetical protein
VLEALLVLPGLQQLELKGQLKGETSWRQVQLHSGCCSCAGSQKGLVSG